LPATTNAQKVGKKCANSVFPSSWAQNFRETKFAKILRNGMSLKAFEKTKYFIAKATVLSFG
jgi:hypothetical protein